MRMQGQWVSAFLCLRQIDEEIEGTKERERETSRMRYALDEISTDAATSCRLQNCLNGDNAMLWQEVPRVSLLPLPELSVYGMLSIQMLIIVSRY